MCDGQQQQTQNLTKLGEAREGVAMIEFSPSSSFAVWGGGASACEGNPRRLLRAERDRILPLFCVGGRLQLARSLSLSLFSAHNRIIPLFCSLGGIMLLLTRENRGAFSEHNRILPLFCSLGGEASAREGRPSQRMIEFSPSFAVCGGGRMIRRVILQRSNVRMNFINYSLEPISR